MTVTPALVVRKSWSEIFEVFELLAFQLVSKSARSSLRLSLVGISARSSRSTAASLEPDRLISDPSCAVGRGQNQKADLLTSEGLKGLSVLTSWRSQRAERRDAPC
jgi:hypothetical protein